MAIFLLDVNVLVALAWQSHSQHEPARKWFDSLDVDQWATCPMTQCSLMRLSLNRKAVGKTITSAEAFELIRTLTAHRGHVFWEDNVNIVESPYFPKESIQGHLQIADAYLLALAVARGGRLATFDQGMSSLARTDAQRAAIALIDA